MTKDQKVSEFREGVDSLKEAIRGLVGEMQKEELDKFGQKIETVNSKINRLQTDVKSQKSEGTRIKSYVDSSLKDDSSKHKDRFLKMETGLREMLAGLKNGIDNINNALAGQGELIKRIDTRAGVLEQRFFDLKKETNGFREMMIRDFDKFRAGMSSLDMDAFEGEVRNDLQRTASNLRKELQENLKGLDSMSVKMNEVEESVSDLKRAKNDMDMLNLRDLRRDVEIVKTRQKWIEENLENLNITPLHDKLTEIENKVRTLRTASATIIE